MSKLALINRQYKREKLVAKYAKRRAALEAIVVDARASDEDRFSARLKLQALPRNANPTRLRNRCAITGRPRGVYSKFGLGRNKLREYAMRGMNITITTTAKTDAEAKALLAAFRFPFKN